jgi:hypothetical protein
MMHDTEDMAEAGVMVEDFDIEEKGEKGEGRNQSSFFVIGFSNFGSTRRSVPSKLLEWVPVRESIRRIQSTRSLV